MSGWVPRPPGTRPSAAGPLCRSCRSSAGTDHVDVVVDLVRQDG